MARPEQLSVGLWIAAGAGVGGGHATRAQALIGALHQRGHRTRVLVRDPAAAARATGGAVQGRSVSVGEAAQWPCDAWIVDLPHTAPAGLGELAQLRRRTRIVACFDASDPEGAVCDLHISAVPGALATRARRLWGTRYAVVGELCDTGPAPADLVACFGAADPAHLSEAALPALTETAKRGRVVLLAGALIAPSRRRSLRRSAEAAGLEWIDAAPRAGDFFAGARVALVPFGQSCLEAIAHGASVALWNPSDAHAAIGRRFLAQCGDWPAVEVGVGPEASRRVTETLRTVAALPRPPHPPVDAAGATRIVAAIEASLRSRGSAHASSSSAAPEV